MPLDNLNSQQQNVVLECLKASVEGPFFPDWEFSVLFGLERAEVREIVDQWPVDDRSDDKAARAINNAMNNLLGYPHGQDEAWPKYISVPKDEVRVIFQKWRESPAKGYFTAMR
jgi:hypothetical protein